MFVVDTDASSYAANADAPQHEHCAALVSEWRERPETWFLTWGICYEFLRAVTHPRVLEHPWDRHSAWGYLEALLASPNLSLLTATDRHADVVGAVVEETRTSRGYLFHDAHTAILMREHGIRRIVTNDADFHRFGFVEVIDPFSEEPPA